jgi:hypothetical protein
LLCMKILRLKLDAGIAWLLTDDPGRKPPGEMNLEIGNILNPEVIPMERIARVNIRRRKNDVCTLRIKWRVGSAEKIPNCIGELATS